jgi:trans-aconitate methyltransferase
MALASHKEDWEELAKLDPLWAICSVPKGKHGGWDLDEFFQSGEAITADVMESAERLGRPRDRVSALDFGCGVGRITRALAQRFDECIGLDISEEMIAAARDLNRSVPNCVFIVNTTDHLGVFEDDRFDLVYTKAVLQHLPDAQVIRAYIAEFVRVLKPGGLLVFQLPSFIPLRYRLELRRKLYVGLRQLGLRPGCCINGWGFSQSG